MAYLFIDGVGSHGTKGTTIEHKNDLNDTFNIQLVF